MRTGGLSFRLSLLGRGGYSFPLRKGGGRGLLFLCTAVLLLCGSAVTSEAFKFPDTGQTKCYQGGSPYAEIPCAGTGQDGAHNINPLSYTDNGNSTVTDNNTGLIWQKYENATYNWYQASGTYDATYNPALQNVCGSLNLGGSSDWRLPSKKELISILDYGIPYPGPTINTTYFPNAHASYYWSSTTFASDPDGAWLVDFDDGHFNYSNKGNYYVQNQYVYVRCVRGEQYPSQSLINNNDGTVTDNATGLMWQQGEGGDKEWDSALSYCEGQSIGNHSDWRLPNFKELESLTDDARYDPAIDISFFPNFPNVNASFYWSSTTNAYYPYKAWYVSLGYGYAFSLVKDDYLYVRCVRGGQVPPSQPCTYTYSDWGTCQPDGTQTRVVLSSSPAGCVGTPVTSRSCTDDTPQGKLEVSATSHDFGAIKTNKCSQQKDFVLTNTGNADIIVARISSSMTDSFTLWNINECVKTIGPSESCKFRISFCPLKSGIKTASVHILSTDPDAPDLSVMVVGVGGRWKPLLDVTAINQSDRRYVWHDSGYTFAAGCVPTSLAMLIDYEVRRRGYSGIDFNMVMEKLREQYQAYYNITGINTILSWFSPIVRLKSKFFPIETFVNVDNEFLSKVNSIEIGGGVYAQISWGGYTNLYDLDKFLGIVKENIDSQRSVAVKSGVMDKKNIAKIGNELKFTIDPNIAANWLGSHMMVIKGYESDAKCSNNAYNICRLIINDANSTSPKYFDIYKISWNDQVAVALSLKGDPNKRVYVTGGSGDAPDLINMSELTIFPAP